MPNYLKLAAESALSAVGIRSQYEQPRYKVAEYVGSVEVRSYGRRLAAEVALPAPDEAAGREEAFGILAAYIFGRNRTGGAAPFGGGSREMPMTAPVETGAERPAAGRELAMTTPVENAVAEDGRFTMRFFLPGALTLATAPTPLDDRVRLVDLPETTLAVLSFSGRASPAVVARRTGELLDTLRPSAWRPAGNPVSLLYDPPFTLPFLRRNEVAVAVEPARRG